MRSLLDLVLPVECVGCGRRGTVVCDDGLRELGAAAAPSWPTPCPPRLPPPWAVAPYDGHVRDFLIAYKEDGAVALRRPLAAALATAVRAALPATGMPLQLVPVPSTRSARRRRGSDVVADLAVTAASILRGEGRDVRAVRALQHVRRVADSAGLTAEQRAVNLSGAFNVRAAHARALAGCPVIVVDDLMTTGVTLRECSDALRATGAHVVAVATVAATRRRGHSP